MRSLITGGAGFIGSHLAEHLLRQGEEVVVLDNLSTGRFDNIRHLVGQPRFRHFIGEVETETLLAEAAEGVDIIYHLAAAVGVDLIVKDPVYTIENNILGTRAVLRHAVRYGKRVLINSSSEVYGKSERLPFAEEDDVLYGPTSRPRWSYAVSKSVDEFLAKAYVSAKGLNCVIVRLFNTVGPRQVGQYGMVIPRLVDQALKGGPLTVYGDGSQTRTFTHVLDVVPALRALATRDGIAGQVVNLGSDEPITIRELAERIILRTKTEAPIQFVPYEVAFGPGFEDMKDRLPDLTRARQLIGYAPQRDIDTIIDDVIADKQERWKPEPDV
jgi:UDP-glucose 4-epimerase